MDGAVVGAAVPVCDNGNMANLSKDHLAIVDPYNKTVPTEVDIAYMSVEIACAVASIFGNLLVIIVFCQYKRLRTITNYYVLSLAVADLFVGLVGIPSAIATSVGLPYNFQGCLFMNSFLMLLCTTSIFSLVAVSVDRFWAIMYPLNYPAIMTRTRAMLIIMFCWILAAIIGLLPSMGWNKGHPERPRCFFMEVMDLRYLAFINFATIVAPTAFMAVVYTLIYRAVQNQVRRMSSHMLSRKGEPTRRLRAESKAAKSLVVIIIMFVISWLPLYTLNTVKCFSPSANIPETAFKFTIALSHLNSVWNPVLYAWGMSDFKEALRRLYGFKPKARTLSVV